ncbi:hypothetical protein COCVIDRAFT_32052 [Bipolaris victoriae FI3]|uniref:Uncharacterized protein n=1 Tax=Bipolaris victoriae (strain FI3) TaxID=930091 RepID=W7DX38_BIPV3|nr:hypothetical protein COCVIDRAFT_32052 [Bipolaris victoriae FI3]
MTVQTTTTKTVVVPKVASAKWDYSYVLSFLMFRVYKIDGWADDGGASLKKEEKSRSALTGWDFEESRTD